VRIGVLPAEEVEAAWGPSGGRRLLEERFDDAPEAARSIDHKPGVGYRLHARHFGLAMVSEDGGEVLCAPPQDEPWSWQRFLVGRILPWAAVLRGVEVFHASGVVLGGRALAFVGATGVGKTSVALHLVLGGAGLLTDDVLAVDRSAGVLRAHPGPGIISVRPAERDRIAPERWHRLGRELGDSGKTYVAVRREAEPHPLGAMYFLERGAAVAGVQLIDPPNPLRVVGSTFNQSIQAPARLRAQFDLCADLAAAVPMYRLGVPDGLGAAQLAELVREHADGLGG